MSRTKAKEKETQISPEEQQILDTVRERKERQERVEEAIIKILKENNASLGVDPNSAIGNPMVVVYLK